MIKRSSLRLNKLWATTRFAPQLSGVTLGVALAGALLAATDFASPLRAPLVLFFLVGAPAAAIAVALRPLDALSRVTLALIGSAVANALVAQALLLARAWSTTLAVVVISVLSAAALLAGLPRRPSRAPAPTVPSEANAPMGRRALPRHDEEESQ